jgi:hypothetical protein
MAIGRILTAQKPRNDPRSLPEIEYWTKAKMIDGKWLRFTIDLREVVEDTLGDQGWLFSIIWKIRLRGTLAIANIKMGSE